LCGIYLHTEARRHGLRVKVEQVDYLRQHHSKSFKSSLICG
jgi:hypothetical protein